MLLLGYYSAICLRNDEGVKRQLHGVMSGDALDYLRNYVLGLMAEKF